MYNPSLHTATNKPIGLTGKPVDARTYFYDTVNFVYRAYVSTSEATSYLIGTDRIGQYSIIINTGGTLSSGVITGGTNTEWWFKDGVADGDLVLKSSGGGSSIARTKDTFTASTGFTLTWTVDMPNGFTQTYFQLFGNLVPDFIVWIGNDTDGYNQNGTTPQVNESSGVVSSVVFTFGVISSGYVRAN